MPCPASSTLILAHAYAGRQASRQAVAIADRHMQTGTCRLAHADWHKQTSKTVVSTRTMIMGLGLVGLALLGLGL